MKKTILFFTILLNIGVYAQEDNKVTWESGNFYSGAQNLESGKTVFERPEGKVREIVYDQFFKSYNISYYDKNGSIAYLEFLYVKDLENGTVIVKEETNGMFAVTNLIGKVGILLFMSMKKIDEENLLFLVFKKVGE